MSLFFYLYRNIYTKLFPDYIEELKKFTEGCKSLLDLGCGFSSPVKNLDKKIYMVGVEIYAPYLYKSRSEGIHQKYYRINVLNIEKYFKGNSFDCVLAGDLIEHLKKKEGLRLITMMEKISKKKVIIYTPKDFHQQGERDGNIWQKHKSSWEPREMLQLGYQVWGINGIYWLRNENSSIKFRPKIFWRLVTDLTQILVKRRPNLAAQMLCIKTKDER